MRVKNPIEKEVTLNYKGELFTIKANSTQDFPTDIAKHWIYIYGFMSIEADEKPVVKEEPKEVIKKVAKK